MFAEIGPLTIHPENPLEGDGDNVVDTIGKKSYRDGKVWINKTQYFADVPDESWNLYIGGYQPAQ